MLVLSSSLFDPSQTQPDNVVSSAQSALAESWRLCFDDPTEINQPAARMRRREFIFGLATLANLHRASAQDRIRRLGVLITHPNSEGILEPALKERGWIPGRNLQIEYRITGGDTDLTRKYARELLAFAAGRSLRTKQHIHGRAACRTLQRSDGFRHGKRSDRNALC
jgi:hypothetical protein